MEKLYLDIEFDREVKDLEEMLGQILPYVPGLKSLHLEFYSEKNTDGSYNKDFLEILRLSQLEELTIECYRFSSVESPELFLNQLPTCCPKLRVLVLGK